MMILVTGGSGFLGISIVRDLIRRGYKVRSIDLVPPDKDIIKKIDYVQGDITNYSDMLRASSGVDTIIHTAALVPISKAGSKFVDVNVLGTRSVLQSAVDNKVRKVVHISSSAIYGIPKRCPCNEKSSIQPIGKYGNAKWRAELECFKYMKRGLNVTILRPRTIIGEGRLGIVALFFDWIKRGKNIYTLGNGRNIYQLVSIKDLVQACCLAIKKGDNQIINLGAERYGTLRQDLQAVVDYARTGSKIVGMPAKPVELTLHLLDKLKLSPFVSWHYMTLAKNLAFETSKAKKVLGWKPKDSDAEMLIEAYQWFLDNYDEVKNRSGTTHRLIPNQGILKLVRFFS